MKIQFLVYWLLAFFRIRRHQRNIQLLASELQSIQLDWLYYLLFFLLGMYLLWLNTVYFHIEFTDKITAPAYLLASFFIAFYAFKQKEVFAYSEPVLKDLDNIFETTNETLSQDRLEEEQVQAIKNRIQNFMSSTEIYLDTGLSLPALAHATGYAVHDLSFVINRGFNENFYQFINSYRLEKAKILLRSADCQHLNIAGIAFACGFNSKTVFNTAFKKLTGLTPSEYKKAGSE
ncbi:helix-turn-helix domain-containing protein [Arcticibacter eurypsychrophilus]|uniref:helix-turn-helix domain-containing protein n=1 Tax=Arcticibacter eurypsychrophilus TaxID=1434752 RepID=UPI00147DE4FD|nr:AraC family transcriptional regulator [Arcticibacter eurypsychrophilus]